MRAVLPADSRNASSHSNALAIDVAGIHKIKHVVVIMQENRSFDSYFGTYPGADGIPAGACASRTRSAAVASRPFHDPADENFGGPHGAGGGDRRHRRRADGRVRGPGRARAPTAATNDPTLQPLHEQARQAAVHQSKCVDVMGYHDAREIPNYWTYAHDFVLQDHMFEPNASWSLPARSTRSPSGRRSARTRRTRSRAMNALENPNPDGGFTGPNDGQLHYAWTDMTYLLHNAGVSWGYYVFKGTEPDCENDQRDDVRAGPAGPADARDLEPAAVVHRRHAGRPARQHPVAAELLHGRRRRARCPPSRGSSRTAPSPSIRRRSSARARPTSPA